MRVPVRLKGKICRPLNALEARKERSYQFLFASHIVWRADCSFYRPTFFRPGGHCCSKRTDIFPKSSIHVTPLEVITFYRSDVHVERIGWVPPMYSFSETQLRALRNSLWRHFFLACNTRRHHREKAENTSEIWIVEIARGVLLTSFIIEGRSLDEVGERYRYKIPVKRWQKPREVVVKILMFIARATLRCFSARVSCTHAQFCSRRRSQKSRKSTFWPQSTQKLTV